MSYEFALVWLSPAANKFDQLKNAAIRSRDRRGRSKRTKATPQEGLFKQVEKGLRLLASNPRHPGLQTHEFTSLEHPYDPDGKVWEAYVQHRTPGAYRLFWCYGPEKRQITIIAITPHP